MASKLLVTGATGFIGSSLVRKLLDLGHDVSIIKRSTSKIDRIADIISSLQVFDVDKVGMSGAFAGQKYDYVINLVSSRGRGELPSQTVQSNIIFTLQLLEEVGKSHTPNFFHIDTSLSSKTSLYSYTKSVSREIITQFYPDVDIKLFFLTLEYVYGAGDSTSNFLPYAIEILSKNETLNMTKGEQRIDFISIDDCVAAIVHLLNTAGNYKNKINNFEVGSGKTTTLKRVILGLKKELNSTSKITLGATPYREHEQMYSRANISSIKGWKPKHTLFDYSFKNKK